MADYGSMTSTTTTSISASSLTGSSPGQKPDTSDTSPEESYPGPQILKTPIELFIRVHNAIRLVFFMLVLLVQDTIAYRISGSRSASQNHRRSTSATASDDGEDAGGWHWIAGRRHRAKREIVGALTWTFGWLPVIVLGIAVLAGLYMAQWASGLAATFLVAGLRLVEQ